MGREFPQSKLRSILLHDMPDDLFCYPITPDSSGSANTPKQLSVRNCSCIHPLINSVFDPVRDRNSSEMASLANQIDYYPMVFPTLKLIDCQVGKFTRRTPQPNKTARIARSRLPLRVKTFAAAKANELLQPSAQLPSRTPRLFAPSRDLSPWLVRGSGARNRPPRTPVDAPRRV